MHIMCAGEQNAHFLVINSDQLRKVWSKSLTFSLLVASDELYVNRSMSIHGIFIQWSCSASEEQGTMSITDKQLEELRQFF